MPSNYFFVEGGKFHYNATQSIIQTFESLCQQPLGHPVNQYNQRAYTIVDSNGKDKWKHVLMNFRRATKSLKLKSKGLKLECREIGTHTMTLRPRDSHHFRTLRKEGRKDRCHGD